MNFRSVAFAALSGILLALSFPNFNIPAFAWIGFIPLFVALTDQTVKRGFWIGGIAGLAYFIGTVSWVVHSMRVYGGISLIPAALIMLLLCAYLALYAALFGAAAVHLRMQRPGLFFLAAPALWTALELARTYIFTGFPWSLIGYSQYRVLPIIQIADITGVYGLSFLIVLVNAAIAEFFLNRKNYRAPVIAALCFALALGYGFVRLRAPEMKGGFTVSVIQGNIEQDKKWDASYQADVFAAYKRLTRETLKERPDLVIWPETATPFYFNGDGANDRAMTKELISFVQANNVPLLFGSPTYERKLDRHIIARNSAFLLLGNGRTGAEYHKMHLVPFGEYVPLKKVLFFIGKLVQEVGDAQEGNEYTVMTVPPKVPGSGSVKTATVICYEIIFPDLVRRFVDRGASIITTVTNDAWFGTTAAPYQHFSMAVFRAIENRVPVARAANTGISGFIDATGRILASSGIFTEAAVTKTLTPGTNRTFYTRYGDLFAYACVVMTLILVAGLRQQVH